MSKVSISEAATTIGVSLDTLRRWDKRGLLRSERNSQGTRQFELEDVINLHKKLSCRVTTPSSTRRYEIFRDANPNGFNAIDLFAGAGGTALGLSNAGFSHVLLSELDTHATATLRLNRPDWNIVEGDVAKIDFLPYHGKIDLLEGGFPCQAFSYAGRSRGFEDTRGTLFFEFARAISETMPKVFIGENVRGLLRHDQGRTLSTMMQTLKNIKDSTAGTSYRIAYRIVRSQYHHVPQKRERLIIIGIRSDVGKEIFFPREQDHIVTLWDAIGDRPESPGQKYPKRKHEILSLVPPGGYWRDLPEDLQKEYLGGSYHLSGGKTGMARRLSWDEPSLTLTCSPAQKQTERCHPEETRPLNIREYARIQTFPDNWIFSGSISNQYKQIGNAVPVNLGYYLGKCAVAMLTQQVETDDNFVSAAQPHEYVN